MLRNALLSVTCGIVTTACASAPPPPPPVSTEPLRCEQPVLVIEEEQTPARQVQADITIVASIDAPECERAVEVRHEHRNPGLTEFLTGPDNRQFYQTRFETEVLRIAADGFAMEFTITNQTERVFRGEGAVWAVIRDGNSLPVTADGLVTLTVLPGRSGTLRVSGIPLPVAGQGTEESVYVLSLYDVVTRRDEAGNPAGRSNFEWIYALRYQNIEQGDPDNRACNVIAETPELRRLVQDAGSERCQPPSSGVYK